MKIKFSAVLIALILAVSVGLLQWGAINNSNSLTKLHVSLTVAGVKEMEQSK